MCTHTNIHCWGILYSKSMTFFIYSIVLCVFFNQECWWWLFFSSSPSLSWLLGRLNKEDVSEEKTAPIQTPETIRKAVFEVNERYGLFKHIYCIKPSTVPFYIYESNGTHDCGIKPRNGPLWRTQILSSSDNDQSRIRNGKKNRKELWKVLNSIMKITMSSRCSKGGKPI